MSETEFSLNDAMLELISGGRLQPNWQQQAMDWVYIYKRTTHDQGTFEDFRRELEQAPYLFVKSGTNTAETQRDMETLFEFVRTHWDEVSSTHVYHP